MNKTYILYFLIFITFTFCKKEETRTIADPPPTIYKISQKVKNFNFKPNSKWILKNTINNNYDTIYVTSATPVETTTEHNSFKNISYDSFWEGMHHTLLPASWNSIAFKGDYTGLVAGDRWGSIEMGLGFFEKNIGDSILYSNSTTWNKIENIYPTITINGNTYNDVYEMSYHPCWYGFSKIWWCPGIGFVKLEGTNTATNQFGSWELSSYNVSLY
jgi:hypothetical protein